MSYGYLSQMLEYLTGAYARSDIRNSRHSLPMETNIGRLFGTLAWGLENHPRERGPAQAMG